MAVPTHYVGLDLDLKRSQITACIGARPWRLLAGPSAYADSLAGFQQLVAWLEHQHCTAKQTVLCMPTAGFLGEPLAYYLALRGYRIAVAPPIKIKRALHSRNRDRREIGSREVAEYACRHSGHLHPWQPSAEKMRQVEALLIKGSARPRRSAKSGAKSTRSNDGGGRVALVQGDQTRAVDAEMRRLLMQQPTITEEWPCY